jgi:hypothetical protein
LTLTVFAFNFFSTVAKVAKNAKNRENLDLVGKTSHTPFGLLHNDEAASARGFEKSSKVLIQIGPQEKNIGKLKKKCPILTQNLMNWKSVDQYVGLCCSLYNITVNLDWMVECGIIDKAYANEKTVRQHEFFNTDVS